MIMIGSELLTEYKHDKYNRTWLHGKKRLKHLPQKKLIKVKHNSTFAKRTHTWRQRYENMLSLIPGCPTHPDAIELKNVRNGINVYSSSGMMMHPQEQSNIILAYS